MEAQTGIKQMLNKIGKILKDWDEKEERLGNATSIRAKTTREIKIHGTALGKWLTVLKEEKRKNIWMTSSIIHFHWITNHPDFSGMINPGGNYGQVKEAM